MIKSGTLIFCCFTSLTFLTACGNQAFDCPYQDGVRCISLAEVDKQISMGRLSEKDPQIKTKSMLPRFLGTEPSLKVSDVGGPSRSREEVLSIWVAPYQSEEGTYHEQNVLHFIAKEAAWTVPQADVETLEEQP